VHGDPSVEEHLARRAADESRSPAELVDAAAALDAGAYLARRCAHYQEEFEGLAEDEGEEPVDLLGTWPDEEPGSLGFTLPTDELTGAFRPTLISVIAVADPAEVPAVFGWGAWNECPAPGAHVAVLRRWAAMYGAEVVGISEDIIEMRVARPPVSRDDALALAREQFAYCPDIVAQGVETISNLAATLRGSTAWYFWWD
jgi:hypothetical protein